MRWLLAPLLAVMVAPSAPGREATVALDLATLRYEKHGLQLLRSSVFYNPRTREGARRYLAEIPDHDAARLFGLWWWESSHAYDLESLRARLERRRRGLEALAKTHDKLIVHIAYMPDWLSRRSVDAPGPDLYKGRNLVGPEDPEAWSAALRVLVSLLKPLDAEIYYEFWNEPDIQYWQGTSEEFFELYRVTARTLRAAHPEAKIGGPAANGWQGRLARREEREPLVLEFMRYAEEHDLPLDFVSWHWFGLRTPLLGEAAGRFREEAEKLGLPAPELLITEWNLTRWVRQRRYQPAMMAEALLAMRDARIDVQCMAALEDFHRGEESRQYGLLVQGGAPRPAWEMHKALDALVRGADGLAVRRLPQPHPEMGHRVVLIARKPAPEGTAASYEILTWRCGVDARTALAIQALRAEGYPEADLLFLPPDEWRTVLEDDTPPRKKQFSDAIAAARKRYAECEDTPERLDLTFAEAPTEFTLERLDRNFVPVESHRSRNRVVVTTRPYEVLRLRLRD